MTIVNNTLLNQAQLMAARAKPGFLKIGNDVYTFEFDQKSWVYNVYQNGFYLVNFNCKSLAKAKKWLRDWLQQ